jgi:hypothetical protein
MRLCQSLGNGGNLFGRKAVLVGVADVCSVVSTMFILRFSILSGHFISAFGISSAAATAAALIMSRLPNI